MREKGCIPCYDGQEGRKDAGKCTNLGVRVETVPGDGFKFLYEVKGDSSSDSKGNKIVGLRKGLEDLKLLGVFGEFREE